MGLILAILAMIVVAFFAWANLGNLVDFHLLPPGVLGETGYDAVGIPVWGLLLGSALVTAIVSWICGWSRSSAARRRYREKEQELSETRNRLHRVEASLQEYEGRIHDFTLKVLELARNASTAGQLEASIGEVEAAREALAEGKQEES